MHEERWEEQEGKMKFSTFTYIFCISITQKQCLWQAFEPSVRAYHHRGAQRPVITFPPLNHKYPENASGLNK